MANLWKKNVDKLSFITEYATNAICLAFLLDKPLQTVFDRHIVIALTANWTFANNFPLH